jgi:hypothetical protein
MSTLSFTLIQTHLHWEDKAANLAMLEQKIMGIRKDRDSGIARNVQHRVQHATRKSWQKT